MRKSTGTEVKEAGLNPMMPPVPAHLMSAAWPALFKHGKEKVPKLHLGLFDHAKKDDRKQPLGSSPSQSRRGRGRPPANDDGPRRTTRPVRLEGAVPVVWCGTAGSLGKEGSSSLGLGKVCGRARR